MIQEIRTKILDLCENKEKWKSHIKFVVKYSKLLAKQIGADEEICEISAWLHDIKKLKGEDENHHIRGAEEAEEILKKYNYSVERIEQVKHCIISHSSDIKYPPISVEAKIVASADKLNYFYNFLPTVHKAFVSKNYSIEEAKIWLIKKYEKSWNSLLIPEAKQFAKPKYDAIKLLLEE